MLDYLYNSNIIYYQLSFLYAYSDNMPPTNKFFLYKASHITMPNHKSKKKISTGNLRDVKVVLKTIEHPFFIKTLRKVGMNGYLDILLKMAINPSPRAHYISW